MSVGEEWQGKEALTEREALAVVQEWLDNRIEKPLKGNNSQKRWIMEELGQLCVIETLRCREDEPQLCSRLSRAWDIAHNIWFAIAPPFATKFYSGDNIPSEEEQERIDKARHVIWRRRDPKKAYLEGYNSSFQTSFSAEDFAYIVGEYVERPWLRHPFLDWVIVDVTVSRELCSFGEELKQNCLPGRRDFVGLHHRYFSAAGNLQAMTKFDWNETFERWNMWFWGVVAFPVAAIWVSFHFGYNSLGGWLFGIYATAIFFALTWGALRLARKLFRWLRGKSDPRTRPFELWTDMYEVWRRLEGPVINPQRVRDAMQASADKGAVWDSATWSVIDRVISISPAVWVPHPTRD
ncbi:hypothetical protein GOD03_17330 [Sinorhizobium medicae]|nr:hypothetical protein [Sinorhizobium medicae]